MVQAGGNVSYTIFDKVDIGIDGFEFGASIYDQEIRFSEFAYDFFPNKLSLIIAFTVDKNTLMNKKRVAVVQKA